MPYDSDFDAMERLAATFRRAEARDDFNNEMAGRDVGRIARFLPGETSPQMEARKRRERLDKLVLETALAAMLRDPIYRARHEAFGVFLASAEQRTDMLLANAQSALASVRSELDDMLDNANRLPDGTRVFRYADGRMFDADGTPVSAADAAGVIWKDGAPTAEQYLDARRREDEATNLLREFQDFRTDLGDTRNAYENADDPITTEQMDERERTHGERLDDLQGRLKTLEPDGADRKVDQSTFKLSSKPTL